MSDNTNTMPTTPTTAERANSSEDMRTAAAWLRLLIRHFGRHDSFAGRATVEYATTALAAIERVGELETERAEHDELLALQHSRTVEADRLWRAAHPERGDVWPDLGELIGWLLRMVWPGDHRFPDLTYKSLLVAADQRARDAEARAANLAYYLRIYDHAHETGNSVPLAVVREARAALSAATPPAPAASEPATATPASGGGEATSGEGRGDGR